MTVADIADIPETPRRHDSGVKPPASEHAKSKCGGRTQADDWKHKVEVADAIMKRLHKKNQELIAQVEQLKKKAVEPSASLMSSTGSSTSLVEQLRQDLARRDIEIRALRDSLSSSTATKREPAATSSSTARLMQLHNAEREKWKAQYNDLLAVKLEFIAQGEATAKVNKEVKNFFQAMKTKMVDDALHREMERAAMNELLFELEQRLASLER